MAYENFGFFHCLLKPLDSVDGFVNLDETGIQALEKRVNVDLVGVHFDHRDLVLTSPTKYHIQRGVLKSFRRWIQYDLNYKKQLFA